MTFYFEIVNIEKLDKVIKCGNLPLNPDSDDKDWELIFRHTLSKYKRNTFDNKIQGESKIKIHYEQKNEIGRFTTPYGFQNFQGDVRKYLADDKYIDIDMKNCHPTILNTLIDKHIIKDKTNVTNFMSRYIISRETFLKKHNLDKITFLKFMNNDMCKNINLENLHEQIYGKLVPILKKKNKNIWSLVKSKNKKTNYNKDGKFLATYLQHIENQILQILVQEIEKKKVTIGCLIHDGLMYEKVNGENPLSYQDVIEIEENILEKTTYDMKLVFKSTDTDWEPIGEIKEQHIIEEIDEIDENEIEKFTVSCVVAKILQLAGDNIVYTGSEIWYKNASHLWVSSDDNLELLFLQYCKDLFYIKESKNEDEEGCKIEIMDRVSNWNNYNRYAVSFIKNFFPINNNFVNTLNCYKGYIPFQDFVYNLETKEKIPLKDFKYPITKTTGKFPRTRNVKKIEECVNMLKQNFNGNEEMMSEFFKFLSRSLAGNVDKRWLLAFGERNSGKSMILKMIDNAFGGLYGTIDGDAFSYNKNSYESAERVNAGLAPLCEHNLVCSSELKTNMFCADKIKTGTSGGDKLIYRSAYGRTKTRPITGGLACFLNVERQATDIDCFSTCIVCPMPCYFETKPDPEKVGIWKLVEVKNMDWILKSEENKDAFIWMMFDFYGEDIYPLFEGYKDDMIDRLRGSDPFALFCDIVEFTNDKKDRVTNEDILKLIKHNELKLKLVSTFTGKMRKMGSNNYSSNGKRGYDCIKIKKIYADDGL